MALAFEGIRVLDFSQVLSGPYATEQFALQGADVIKVERPGTGEQGRMYAVPHEERAGERVCGLFLAVNANKRSLSLDLKRPEAREVLSRLMPSVDVVVENFKAGGIGRMGFGYDWARSLRPDVVYCSITGYGQTGPRAAAPAYDHVIQAASGAMSYNGLPETGPIKSQYPVADIATGMTAAFAIAAALVRRGRTGEGQHLDVSMLDTMLHMQAQHVMNYVNASLEPRLMGNGTLPANPASTVYPTRHGFVHISLITQAQFEALCAVLERPDLLADPRFATREDRVLHRAELRGLLKASLVDDDAAAWERRLSAAGVPAAAVATLPQVVADPQVVHRDLLAPAPGGGPVVFNPAFRADRGGGRAVTAPPGVGEHSRAILADLGYDEAQIEAVLRSAADRRPGRGAPSTG